MTATNPLSQWGYIGEEVIRATLKYQSALPNELVGNHVITYCPPYRSSLTTPPYLFVAECTPPGLLTSHKPLTASANIGSVLQYGTPESVSLLQRPFLDLEANITGYLTPANYGSASFNKVAPLYPGATVMSVHFPKCLVWHNQYCMVEVLAIRTQSCRILPSAKR